MPNITDFFPPRPKLCHFFYKDASGYCILRRQSFCFHVGLGKCQGWIQSKGFQKLSSVIKLILLLHKNTRLFERIACSGHFLPSQTFSSLTSSGEQYNLDLNASILINTSGFHLLHLLSKPNCTYFTTNWIRVTVVQRCTQRKLLFILEPLLKTVELQRAYCMSWKMILSYMIRSRE